MENLSIYVANELAPLVNSFRVFQAKDGSVKRELELAKRLLAQIIVVAKSVYLAIGQEHEFELFRADVEDWLSHGLGQKPNFKRIANSVQAPRNQKYFFVIAPVRCPNSFPPNGFFLECVLAIECQPESLVKLREKYNHKKVNPCQSTRMIAASKGFERGNCIVFFPENVAGQGKIAIQNYAVFFFNKFRKIYLSETIPASERLLGLLTNGLASLQLNETEAYEARCVWGYLHDYYHHVGVRPIDENLTIKTNWYVGLLEEVKVDCQAALACISDLEIPYCDSVFEYIILDRACRYPLQIDALNNFDSGTGVLLLSWLYHKGCFQANNRVTAINSPEIIAALQDLVDSIVSIESIKDNDLYLEKARVFVEQYIGKGRNGERFPNPADHPPLNMFFSKARIKPVVNDFFDLCL